MAYVIENNSFSGDTYNVRSTRLNQLQGNIDTYSTELQIPADLLTWAQSSHDNWTAAWSESDIEQGEKKLAYQESSEAFADLSERYQTLKDLLIVRYGQENKAIALYGLQGQTPREIGQLEHSAQVMIDANTQQLAAGDTNALPQTMMDNLQTLVDTAETKHRAAKTEAMEADRETDTLVALYNTDANNLRLIYNWIVAFWGKKNPQLLALGFALPKERGSNNRPAVPTGLAYDLATTTASWNAVADATSYQLAYRATDGEEEWQVAFEGQETSVAFNPGSGDWMFRVRARNVHGFGEFSSPIDVQIPVGDAPEAPATPNLT